MFNRILLLPGKPLLQSEIDRARNQLLQAVFEYDELIYKDCLHLENQFFLRLGPDYLSLIKSYGRMVYLRRAYQAYCNYEGKELEDRLADHQLFRDKYDLYLQAISQKIERANQWAFEEEMDLEQSRLMRRYFREIVEKVHPLLHPIQSKAQEILYQKALTAYRREDMEILQMIWENLQEDYAQDNPLTLPQLYEERKSLILSLYETRAHLALVRSDFPYRIRYHVLVEEHCEKMRQGFHERKQAIEQKNHQLESAIAKYLYH